MYILVMKPMSDGRETRFCCHVIKPIRMVLDEWIKMMGQENLDWRIALQDGRQTNWIESSEDAWQQITSPFGPATVLPQI